MEGEGEEDRAGLSRKEESRKGPCETELGHLVYILVLMSIV